MFEALGFAVFRHRWLVLVLSAAFLLGSVAVLLRGGELTGGDIRGLEAGRAQEVVDRVTGRATDVTFVAIFRATAAGTKGTDLVPAMAAALAPLRGDPRVAGVIDPAVLPPPMAASMIDGPGGAAYALVTMRGDLKTALQEYPAVRALIGKGPFEVACTGRLPFLHDLDRTLEHDLIRAELVSLPLALLVLLLVFRTVVAATVPVAVGALAVVGGIAGVLALSRHADIAQFTINVCSLIGLGVAIDYSLFMVSRYREELAAGRSHEDALVRAMGTAGRVVGFSGIAVGTGLSGLLFFEGSYLRAMGIGGVIVVVLAVVFALTFLPALLAVLGDRIHAGRLTWRALERADAADGAWHRMALRVMNHPLRFLVPTLGALIVMGIPFLHIRLAAADVRVLSGAIEARHGYDLLREHFPDQAANRIAVAVSFPSAPALTPERAGALGALTQRIAALPGVHSVASPLTGAMIPVGDDAFVLFAVTGAAPESDAARAIVHAIRADRRVADGALLVGGVTANDVDSTDYILTRAPRAVGLVVGATILVLFLLLGSVVLPLKAVVMNFFSIAGSFGALVWIFQDGHLLGIDPRPVEPSLPILLFCILFGLSMDYEVLMLSRMKESYEKTRDNTHAVADGLEKTAGLITSAAAIMVAVFGAFGLASVVLVKAVGLGMALAVALDATLVRVLLVPATMRLFGHLNWWAPRPLRRFRRALGLDHSA